jgi:hypothetical protein
MPYLAIRDIEIWFEQTGTGTLARNLWIKGRSAPDA